MLASEPDARMVEIGVCSASGALNYGEFRTFGKRDEDVAEARKPTPACYTGTASERMRFERNELRPREDPTSTPRPDGAKHTHGFNEWHYSKFFRICG